MITKSIYTLSTYNELVKTVNGSKARYEISAANRYGIYGCRDDTTMLEDLERQEQYIDHILRSKRDKDYVDELELRIAELIVEGRE